MTTASMDMTEALLNRNETAEELRNSIADGTTGGTSFKALVRRLADLNEHLSNQGYNGTSN